MTATCKNCKYRTPSLVGFLSRENFDKCANKEAHGPGGFLGYCEILTNKSDYFKLDDPIYNKIYPCGATYKLWEEARSLDQIKNWFKSWLD